jgi:hypothetical protein
MTAVVQDNCTTEVIIDRRIYLQIFIRTAYFAVQFW